MQGAESAEPAAARGRVSFKPQSHKEDFLLGFLIAALHSILVTAVYKYVPTPYMDEIFHIGQTRSYCNGNFTWNPLITTPPALYFLAVPFCYGQNERYVNSLLILLAVAGFCRFRRMFSRDFVLSTAVIVQTLPVLLHSSVLLYTDLLSLTAVVWGLSIRSPSVSALCFLVATLTRQTNIVWAAVYAASRLLARHRSDRPFRSTFSSLLYLWPFELLALAFAAFVVINDGKFVLGDAKAHEPKLHLAQFFYCLIFCAAHGCLQALPLISPLLKKALRPSRLAISLVVAFCFYRYSYDHPYLLADNRHFTFYIWRRFLANPLIRTSLAPICVLSADFMNLTTAHVAPIHRILFLFATLAVLVPAHFPKL
ncbi:unnamed protein product [Caenorhabditis auriculariae]|uniref:Dol-P-Glc:Glc(2)Man(9)GlcNAc(2)-PP-Dol alpha-1,2-glucosyltransferase n=1 Tax=Caenorhabditis auriculariae TaxID=2777116 RepID=A0A8S1H627_9PELO|nr:unnamed protein product [Caenorhabditis auriculariae]